MLGSLGFPEILFILLLALLVFGPKRLPEVGRKIGKALGEFRRATGDLKRSIDREMTIADMGVSKTPPNATRARSEGEEQSTAAEPADEDAPDDPYSESTPPSE